MKTLAPSLILFFFATTATSAAAQEADEDSRATLEAAKTEAALPPPKAKPAEMLEIAQPRYDVVRVNAGFKLGYVTTDGFDAFARNNALPQLSIDGTVPVLERGKLVLGIGLGWDVGGRSASLRGAESSLTTHRLTVPIEVRWNYVPGLYTFVKVAPGAAAMMASVADGSRTLETTGWAFAADASAGASILLGSRKTLYRREVRFWVTPEAGYGITTAARLRMNPGRADDQILGSDEDTNLRSLALSGAFWRISVSATY